MPKTLYFDLECAPALVYTWSFRKAFIGLDQVVEHPRILGFAWMWEGNKRAKWVSEFDHPEGRLGMLKELHALLDEAEIVVGFNSVSFDQRYVEGEFIIEGMPPPSPYHHIDVYKQMKAHSFWPSGKLEYTAQRLLGEGKVKHDGFSMWVGCLNGDPKAWKDMARYAKVDVELLPPLYEKLRPWHKTHPNVALIDGKEHAACSKCGSTDIQRRGYATTAASRFQRYRCNSCGGWSKSRLRVSTNELRNA